MKSFFFKKMTGFSLIEAMIAALIVGVGILGLAKLQSELFLDNSLSRMQTHALNSAQEKIEELRGGDYLNLSSGQDTIAGENANFTRAWTLVNCPNSLNCRQVSVSVSWTDARHGAEHIQLSSYIGDIQPVKSGVQLVSLATTTTAVAPTTTTATVPTTTTTITAVSTTTTAGAGTTTSTAPASTTTGIPTTTTSGSQTPTSFVMTQPGGCTPNSISSPCQLSRGAEDGETIAMSFKDTNGNALTNPSVSVTFPSIIVPTKQLQPQLVGSISVSNGVVSFLVRAPGCFQNNGGNCEPNGSWVGLSNTAFTIIVTVNGVPFTIYMKTDS